MQIPILGDNEQTMRLSTYPHPLLLRLINLNYPYMIRLSCIQIRTLLPKEVLLLPFSYRYYPNIGA